MKSAGLLRAQNHTVDFRLWKSWKMGMYNRFIDWCAGDMAHDKLHRGDFF